MSKDLNSGRTFRAYDADKPEDETFYGNRMPEPMKPVIIPEPEVGLVVHDTDDSYSGLMLQTEEEKPALVVDSFGRGMMDRKTGKLISKTQSNADIAALRNTLDRIAPAPAPEATNES